MSRLIESGTTDGVGFGNADETDAPLNVAGQFNVAGTLNLDQALGISGVVLDDSQSPIQNATVGVTLTENGNDVIYDTTDANGAYSFTEHPDGDPTKQEWHVTAAKNDAGDLFNAESKPFVRGTLVATAIEATGGDTIQDVTLNGVDYRIHAFTTVGSQAFQVTSAPSNASIDVLLVGGGGAGSGRHGGGGGAGGLVFVPQFDVPQQLFNITVGGGGTGAVDTNDNGTLSEGGDTTALGLTALGGGRPGNQQNSEEGGDGGSGGGGNYYDTNVTSEGGLGLQPTLAGLSGSNGFGNDGGSMIRRNNGSFPGGGGGGAGQAGESVDDTDGGDGGNGLAAVSIDGTTYNFANTFGTQFGETVGNEVYFAGGGAGGVWQEFSPGVGGFGGGGDGGAANTSPPAADGEDGLANTGGGGGGAGGDNQNHTGGDGGSGIVLIRYEI